MKYPKFIKKGSTLAFPAPSFGASIEPYNSLLKNAEKQFNARGYNVDFGPNAFAGEGMGISNTPKKCAEELMDYYLHHGDALISVGGGELMCTTIECMDFSKLQDADPKWFLGYSDNTNFGFLLPTLLDVASLYGPNAAEFGMESWHQSLNDVMSIMDGSSKVSHGYDLWESEQIKDESNPLASYNLNEKSCVRFINYKEDFSGRFIGGCLDCLINLCGTRFDKAAEFCEKYKEDGIVWFLEACELSPMGIYRALWQLKNAGWFKYAKGFVFGRPLCINAGKDFCGVDQYVAAEKVLGDLNVPIVMNADIGHLPPSMPMINGGFGKLYRLDNNIQIEWDFTK